MTWRNDIDQTNHKFFSSWMHLQGIYGMQHHQHSWWHAELERCCTALKCKITCRNDLRDLIKHTFFLSWMLLQGKNVWYETSPLNLMTCRSGSGNEIALHCVKNYTWRNAGEEALASCIVACKFIQNAIALHAHAQGGGGAEVGEEGVGVVEAERWVKHVNIEAGARGVWCCAVRGRVGQLHEGCLMGGCHVPFLFYVVMILSLHHHQHMMTKFIYKYNFFFKKILWIKFSWWFHFVWSLVKQEENFI